MDAKKYLGQLKLLDARINNSRQELAALRRILQDMQSVDYSVPKVQVSHTGSTMEKTWQDTYSWNRRWKTGLKSFAP